MNRSRSTRQKQVIFSILKSLTTHPTADELFHLVRVQLPSISLGTVYRNLDRLVSSGQIQKLDTAGSQKRFDACTTHHSHIRCIKCGRVDDVDLSVKLDEITPLVTAPGYQILGQRLEFVGLCPQCIFQANRNNADSLAKSAIAE